MELKGQLFETSSGGGAGKAVSVLFTEQRIVFTPGSLEVALDYHDLSFSLGGDEARQLVIRPARTPDFQLFFGESEWRRLLTLGDASALQTRLRGLSSVRRSAVKRFWIRSALLLSGIAAFFVRSYEAVLWGALQIPASWETELGDVAYAVIAASTPIVHTPEADAAIESIMVRLREVTKDEPYTFSISVADSPEVNAFALPGGHIVLNSALLKQADSADELAGVLGHEMQHVIRRHSLRHMVRELGFFSAVAIIAGKGSSIVWSKGRELVSLSFSRDDEREADRLGVTLLHRAGLDPRGLKTFMERLARGEDGVQKSLSLMSTHPLSSERVDEIESVIQSLPNGGKAEHLSIDWEIVKKSLPEPSKVPADGEAPANG